MPQVPYSPVPTETPSGPSRGPISINAPVEAFGGAVAKSLEGLGRVVDRAGDEMFQRAVAIQQLHNDSIAKEADSNYMMKAGELHAQYSARQGKERVDAFPKYMKDLEEARVQTGAGLNPAARKIYDGSTRSTMSRTIFNGAGAAASAQKEFTVTTAVAQMDLDAKTVEDSPNDDRLFQDKLRRTIDNVKQVSASHGNPAGSVQEQALEQKAISKLYADRITGLARVAPFEADQRLNEVKGNMTQQDFLRVQTVVRSEGRAIGATNIANEVFEAGLGDDKRPQVSLSDMEASVREKAKKLKPDDPNLATAAVASLRGRYNQHNYSVRQEKNENLSIVQGAILKGVIDERQLRQDPKVAAAIDALPESERLSIPGRINRYNAARDKVTNQDAFQELKGLYNNDTLKFLETDLTKFPLSQSDLRQLQNLQAKERKESSKDPLVQKYSSIMRQNFGAQMEELKVYRRDKDNPELYDKMTGAVSGALDAWMQAKGKPPTPQEFIKDIAPQILYQRAEPGMLWGTNRKPAFDPDAKAFKGFVEKTRADYVTRNLPEPTDGELQRAYIRLLMSDLFGKPKQPAAPRP